jgi:hypothetical protein
MKEQWQELKETITEMRDNDGTSTQQEVCRFLVNYMNILEKQMQEPRWIPVTERLPEENKTVIASTKDGVYPETRYSKEYGWEWAFEAGTDYWVDLEDVTAWMPLPEPYEPQESEE